MSINSTTLFSIQSNGQVLSLNRSDRFAWLLRFGASVQTIIMTWQSVQLKQCVFLHFPCHRLILGHTGHLKQQLIRCPIGRRKSPQLGWRRDMAMLRSELSSCDTTVFNTTHEGGAAMGVMRYDKGQFLQQFCYILGGLYGINLKLQSNKQRL